MANSKVALVFPAPAVRATVSDLVKKNAAYWENKGKRMALALFSYARENVPAYREHLKKADFDAKKPVRTMRAFMEIPAVTKDNYLRIHPYKDLFPPLGLHSASTVSATSGSTGEPFFFPRATEHDRFYERSMEILLSRQWDVGKRSTLCIIGFAHGIWIGGIFTYKVFNRLAEKKLPMTLIPVGVNKDLYLKAFKKFAPLYDQTVLMGYPPFLKDVLERGKEQHIDWTKHRLRILTAAEGYSERFRNHLAEISGCDPVRDMVNIYGTVEQGTVAHETAVANMIRHIAYEREDVFNALFPDAQNIPTLAQYYPDHVYFEAVDGKLIASGYGSSIPLVRYAFNDLGGVIPFNAMKEKLAACSVDMAREAKKYGIADTVMPLPFVYVHARADFVIVYRGANIYPEEIRAALDNPVLAKWVTGKFTAVKSEEENMKQALHIHVEMKVRVRPSNEAQKKVLEVLIAEFRSRNSEFNNNYTNDADSSTPNVVLHHHGDPEYFAAGGKQKWVKKA